MQPSPPVFRKHDQLLGIIGLASLAFLLLLAVFFWKERAFFGDASWIAFRTINFGTLQIQEHRYGSFITQVFPLLASKAGLPLKAVLFLYSISFNLFYLVAGLLLFRWRQYDFLFLLALYFTVSFSVGFYWTNNEVHQGMAWLLLAFGWSASAQYFRKFFYYPVAFGLFFLALSSHMLLLLAGCCLWIHLLIARRAPFFGTKRGLVLGIDALLLAGWRYYMSKYRGWYDEEKLSFIDNLHLSRIGEIFSGKSSVGFLERWPTHYPALVALAALALLVLVLQKRWLALGWHLLSLALFWFFISAAFFDFTPWYAESDWASWTMAALIPLALYGFPFPRKAMVVGFVGVVFALNLLRIYQSSAPFRERLQRVERLVAVLEHRRLDKVAILMPDTRPLEEKIILPWPLPVEVYEISAISGKKPVLSLGVIADEAQIPTSPDTLLIPFGKLPARDFNPAYFPVDSVRHYAVFPADSLPQWLD